MKDFLLIVMLLLAGCGGGKSPPPEERDARLSASVAFVHSSPKLQGFLAAPGRSYVEAWFSFPEDLAEDIWFGIDQELVEGVEHPLSFAGADWMGLIALNRRGELGIPVGSAESHSGVPDDAGDWVIRSLSIELKPNTWYRMRGVVDFATRHFVRLELSGPGLELSEDLSGLLLSYPNYIPLDQPAMTYYVFSLRTRESLQPGSTRVFFDDLGAGIPEGEDWTVVFSDGFERQSQATDIPIELPVSPLGLITEKRWYKESEEALLEFTNERSRSGNQSLACDATLKVR